MVDKRDEANMERDAESSRRYKENLDDAVQASKADAAEIAALKESYALLSKAHAAERSRWEDATSMDCASCEYVAPTRHDKCKGCERTVTVHANYKRASWA